MTFDRLCEKLGARSERRKLALRYVLRAWEKHPSIRSLDRGSAAIHLKHSAKLAYETDCKDGPYGFVALILIAGIIFAAALTWAVEKFLDWWWEHRDSRLPVEGYDA